MRMQYHEIDTSAMRKEVRLRRLGSASILMLLAVGEKYRLVGVIQPSWPPYLLHRRDDDWLSKYRSPFKRSSSSA